MQCLFCGKELALLKRLRGGGEFCSEAHRKEYQDQYEQLALARLMQAKPPVEAAPAAAPLGKASAEPANTPDAHISRPYDAGPAAVSIATLEAPPVTAQDPAWSVASARGAETAAQPSPESSPAPLAGFVLEPVVPAVTPFQQAGLELEQAWERVQNGSSVVAVAVLTDSEAPAASRTPQGPPPAPRVGLDLSMQALDHHSRGSERGLELREFTAPAPVIELQLRPETGSDPAVADDVMEILMSPHPPQKAKPWLGFARAFPAAPAELGDLARLNFATTGFPDSDSAAVPQQSALPQAVLAPEVPQAAVAVLETPPDPPVQAEPVPEVFVPPSEPTVDLEPAPSEPAPPELITKVLPVTLHGLAAGHRKLSPAFPRPIAPVADVQIPAPSSLPLRPVIVFATAPAAASQSLAPPAKTEPVPQRQGQTITPEPNQARSKAVPSKPVQPQASQPASAPSKPAERSASSVLPEPKPVQVKREAPVEAPAQRAAAQTIVTAVPTLRVEATESAWSKLSSGVKIGVAAGVIVAISGIAYLVTRGGNKSAPEAPVAASPAPAVATGVPISGGWIDDWASFSRTRRHISVLSGSAKLSDYRLEFQAQIQSKAIGWIFRGLNPRNYYVTKLEITTPGLQPKVGLVHFAVVDGQDEKRVVVPLPMNVRVDTLYKIRFDAIGNRFTTWVQDQKIDEWSDNRFGSGGVGFFSERDEQAAMQGAVNVVPLVPKN